MRHKQLTSGRGRSWSLRPEPLESRTLFASSVGGTVYNDVNRDGTYQTLGDHGLDGLTVYIDANLDGQPSAGELTAVTSGSGYYQFGGLTPGTTYPVRAIGPAGWLATAPAGGEALAVVAPADRFLRVGNDIGFHNTGQFSIVSGAVFVDANGDGSRGASEVRSPGQTAWIDADDDGVRDPDELSAVANQFGIFSMRPYNPAHSSTYRVRVEVPAGWEQTRPAGNGAWLTTLSPGNGNLASDVFGLRALPPPTVALDPGPTEVPEGGAVVRVARGIPAAGRTIARVEWDWDYDRTTFDVDATGSEATFSAAGLDGEQFRTIALRAVDDAWAVSGVLVTAIRVTNVAPTAAFAAGPAVVAGSLSAVSFTGATDPSPADLAAGLRFSVDFNNDGDFDDLGDVRDSASATAGFAYPTAGTYVVRGRVADKDGEFTDYTTTVTVDPPPAPPPPPALPPLVARDLRATADAHARDGSYAGTNYGTAPELQVGRAWTAGTVRQAYLRFDLTPGAPAGGVLESAVLRVFARATIPGGMFLDLHAVAGTTWSEAALTWNARPTAGAKLASVNLYQTVGTWVEFDVSAYVRQQRTAGATKVAFAIRAPLNGTLHAVLASDENATAANRPVLRLGERVTPQIVLAPAAVTVREGGTAAATVRLSSAPGGPVAVTVARAAGGDADLTVAATGLTFTLANWNVPQPVTFAATQDADGLNGTASFAFAATGLATKTLVATEADDDVRVLRAAADAYVRDGTYATTNYGQATTLQVRRGAAAGGTRQTVLKFDLTGLATVSQATLRLSGKLDSTASPNVVVQAFAGSYSTWSEAGVKWGTRPLAIGAAVGQVTVAGTASKWYTIDVTAWLQAQKAAGRTAATLVLTSPVATAAAALFASDEAAAVRPKLMVVT